MILLKVFMMFRWLRQQPLPAKNYFTIQNNVISAHYKQPVRFYDFRYMLYFYEEKCSKLVELYKNHLSAIYDNANLKSDISSYSLRDLF